MELACRCGAIGLEISGEPIAQVYCHCADCQAAHGGAFGLNAIYPAAAVRIIRGDPVAVAVKATPRMRCPRCQTPLFTEVVSAGLRSLNAYLLSKESFQPQCHIHCEDAVLPIVDSLPHYKRLPTVFGGSDERVFW